MYRIIILLCLFGVFACQKSPKLENFDSKLWKKDKLACKNLRKDLIKSLSLQKEKLKGLGQNQIMQILGKPDLQELHNRNQRFYVYFYEKGKICDTPNSIADYTKLDKEKIVLVRFTAIDKVTEVIIQK
jgi:outer membrane protein assembly factor BamE (lipoprotein component of BamABCDE complex)